MRKQNRDIMKKMKITASFLIISLLFSSCVMITTKKDNGKHKGWYKNSNNPHNPAHENSGNNGNGKGKGKNK